MRPLLPSTLALCILIALPAMASATCPESVIQFLPGATIHSTTPQRLEIGPFGSVDYDLVQGVGHSFISTGPSDGGGSLLTATDEYQLVGPAGPAVVPFGALLHVTGTAMSRNDPSNGPSSVTVKASLYEEGTSHRDSIQVTAGNGQVFQIDRTLSLSLAHPVGELFRLELGTLAGSNFADGNITGQLFFDLPAGYTIQSCQGYAGPGSVPIRGKSWGEVKLRYR